MTRSFAILLVLLLGACGSDGGGGSPRPDAGADACAASKFAASSEPCCPDHGADACGGGLFCAALDGRDQAVCYPVGNGAPGSLCESDDDCAAGSPACDPVTHRCERWPITAETIDAFAATDLKLSFHESGRPFVSMNDPAADLIYLALRQETEWRQTRYERDAISIAGLSGPGTDTYVCMAYSRCAGCLPEVVVEEAASELTNYRIQIELEVGSQYATSMAQAADKTLHIGFRHGGSLMHSFGPPGGFFAGHHTEIDTALGSEGHRTSIAVHENVPAIAYNSATEVRFAQRSSTEDTWSTETVSPGRSASLAFDGNGVPHISFFDPEKASIRYATRVDGDWVVEDIVAQGAAERSHIAADGDGVVHVLYHEAESRALVYARRSDAGWVSGVVDTGGPVGLDSAIAVDAAGLVHLAFVDETSSEIRYATLTRP